MNPNGFYEGVRSNEPYVCGSFASSLMKGQLLNQYAGDFPIPDYENQVQHLSYFDPMQEDAMRLQEQSSGSWNHSIPLCMPWFQRNSPFPTQNEVYDGCEQMPRRIVHCKRKGIHFDEAPSACKQYISEEVMAAKLGQLHISNIYSTETMDPSSSCTRTVTDDRSFVRQPATTLEELEARLLEDRNDVEFDSLSNNNESDRVVVLSPEIKKLETDPIIPKSILEKMQKPSMELVLWRPPGGIVDHFIKATLTKKKDLETIERNGMEEKSEKKDPFSIWQNSKCLSNQSPILEEEQLGEDMVC